MMADWCVPDGCPAQICGGPHIRWVNDTGDECLAPAGIAAPPGFRLPPDTPEMAAYQQASNELHELTGD
jgi:hypothetical protein